MSDTLVLVRFLQFRGTCSVPIPISKLIEEFGVARSEVYDHHGDILKRLLQDFVALENDGRKWQVPRTTKHLSIQDRMIMNVDVKMSELEYLTTLRLDRNRLTTLPAALSCLKNLDTLSLSGNYFQTLPDVIYKMSALKSLDISSNEITHIAPELSQLRSLSFLDLERNPFTTLPKVVYELPALRDLFISHTYITDISLDPIFISRLKILRCQDTPLYQRMTKTGAIEPEQIDWCWHMRYVHNLVMYMCLGLNCNAPVLESLSHALQCEQ